MIDLRPLGIEDYAERHSKPLSDIHSKLWLETFTKTRSPAMMVGALEGAGRSVDRPGSRGFRCAAGDRWAYWCRTHVRSYSSDHIVDRSSMDNGALYL